MRLLLIEDEEKTSTYMSGFIASTPPGQEVMPIMGWVCRLCAPSLLCGDAFARSEGGINTFGLTFAMQANKTADNSPSDTESGADKIVREASA
ncbi:TPA: hypothetical protein IFC14_002339 [Escherichia coli]|uniref:Uncharacterized protein n=1 Tax=Escherichia coli TaxID=562 RepID=A0AAN5K3P1_ECOLX|nr:hypothetical protein [Escherichia coli]